MVLLLDCVSLYWLHPSILSLLLFSSSWTIHVIVLNLVPGQVTNLNTNEVILNSLSISLLWPPDLKCLEKVHLDDLLLFSTTSDESYLEGIFGHISKGFFKYSGPSHHSWLWTSFLTLQDLQDRSAGSSLPVIFETKHTPTCPPSYLVCKYTTAVHSLALKCH